MLKVVFLVCGIVAIQLKYCLAGNGEKIQIQKFKAGTIGRISGDVAQVIEGAKLMSDSEHWINLEGATIMTKDCDDTRNIKPSDFPEGTLFRYAKTLDKSYDITTCPLKVVHKFNMRQTNGFTYKTASFTLNFLRGDRSVVLIGNLGAPPMRGENEFGVDMDDHKNKHSADVAMAFYRKINKKFTSKYNGNLTGLQPIAGKIIGVTMRKNRQGKDYLVIKYRPNGIPTNSVAEMTEHPLFPGEEHHDVDLSSYKHLNRSTAIAFAEIALKYFSVLIGPFDLPKTKGASSKKLRITSVTMTKEAGGEPNLAIGQCFG